MTAVTGVAADGRRWELRAAPDRITAVTSTGTIGEAHVTDRGDRVVVELWSAEPGVPSELTTQLVTAAFTSPAVRPERPVLVCIPRHDGGLLAEARRHVRDAQTRAAGVNCLLEGYVGNVDGTTALTRRAHSPGAP